MHLHTLPSASRGNISTRCRPACGAQRARFDVRARKWADELLGLARHYDSAYLPSALCHNDLVAANVLDDGDLVLVDFEYAVRAAPALDLAGLAGMNDYGENECRELLAAYYAGGPPRVSLSRARQDRPDGAARGILLGAARRAASRGG